ncbi:MAG: (deoxy)nucleoside triphosphate pyrophosphohydrolase [Verrucomicrobiae bacterium]|nr:(deoxy)nucleoside triphosphate pyrophosphohydrolase [Verrucomicrobiae bacterium]
MTQQRIDGGKPEVEVSAGLIFKNGRLLIAQRRKNDYMGGLWEFPGGKRNSDETFEECLRRELREELGVDVKVGELLWSMTHEYPELKVHIRFFFCSCDEGEPAPIGCQALTWINREQLGQYKFPEADAMLVDLLYSLPQLWERR